MNVLKPHQKSSVLTLVEREVSQHEISRKAGGESNSPTPATGWGGRRSGGLPPKFAIATDRRHVFVTKDAGKAWRQIAKDGDLP